MKCETVLKTIETDLEALIKFLEEDAKKYPQDKKDEWFEGHLDAAKVFKKRIEELREAPEPVG